MEHLEEPGEKPFIHKKSKSFTSVDENCIVLGPTPLPYKVKSISFKSNLENHLPTKFPQMGPTVFYCYKVRVSKFWAHKTKINKLF